MIASLTILQAHEYACLLLVFAPSIPLVTMSEQKSKELCIATTYVQQLFWIGELEKAELVGLAGGEKPSEMSKESFGSLGFSVQALTPLLAREMGLDEGKVGVVVTEVVPGSPAADKNLQVGDILRRFGQRPVKGVVELSKDIENAEEGGRSGILILIERDGRERFLQIGFAKK